MDTLLVQGDVCINQSGEYAFVKNIDRVLQKAVLCAKIRKGSFVYNKALGTEINNIDAESSNALENASLLLNEAIMEDTGYAVKVENMTDTPQGERQILISVSNGNEIRKQEVRLSADL